MKKITAIYALGLLALITLAPEAVYAKDVIQALQATESKAGQILMALAPISIMVAAAVFQFSKQLGTTLLASSCIGIVIFAGKQGIFDLLFGLFGR